MSSLSESTAILLFVLFFAVYVPFTSTFTTFDVTVIIAFEYESESAIPITAIEIKIIIKLIKYLYDPLLF